jgi:hypothetical protein
MSAEPFLKVHELLGSSLVFPNRATARHTSIMAGVSKLQHDEQSSAAAAGAGKKAAKSAAESKQPKSSDAKKSKNK